MSQSESSAMDIMLSRFGGKARAPHDAKNQRPIAGLMPQAECGSYKTMMSRMITDSGTPNSHMIMGMVTVSFDLNEIIW